MVNVAGRRHLKREKDRKSGFVYRPRKAEDVQRRAERKGGRFDSPFKQGFDTWRPQQGENLIRILPPTWDNYDHYGYTIHTHGWIGPNNSTFLCPLRMSNKKCPICIAAKEAKNAGDADEAKQLEAKEQVVCWILDRNGGTNKKHPQLFVMSWTFDRDIATLTWNKRTGKLLLVDHPDEGFDLSFHRTGQGLNTRYEGKVFERDPTPILERERDQEEVLDYLEKNPVPDTLQFHSYEHMEAALEGAAEEKDEDLESETEAEAEADEEEREAKEYSRTRKSRAAKEEEPDEEDEEEEQDQPRRHARERDLSEDENGEEDPDDNGDEEEQQEETTEDEDEEEEEEEEEARRPRGRVEREPLHARGGNGKSRRAKDDDEEEDEERPPRRKSAREEERRSRR